LFYALYQIIINHWGLSLGEIETINNIFKSYDVTESEVQKNSSYASTLEIEFIKNVSDEFFNCIPINKWNLLVEVIKNIRKRRGNKGLKFGLTITDYFEESQDRDTIIAEKNASLDAHDNEVEIELLFFRRMIFLLGNRNYDEFVKGVERIEIAIENITELFNQAKKLNVSVAASRFPKPTKKEKDYSQIKNEKEHVHLETNIQLYVFIFDYNKRIWKPL
jgi:hypothetical protein